MFEGVVATLTLNLQYAGMVELVDSEDLGSSAERCVGSSPTTRTSDRPAFCDKNAGRLLLLLQ